MEGERIGRHNALRDAIYQLAQQAALAPRREEQALLPGLENRPADVFLPHWQNGQDTALDITVTSTIQLTGLKIFHRSWHSPGPSFPEEVETVWGGMQGRGHSLHTSPYGDSWGVAQNS